MEIEVTGRPAGDLWPTARSSDTRWLTTLDSVTMLVLLATVEDPCAWISGKDRPWLRLTGEVTVRFTMALQEESITHSKVADTIILDYALKQTMINQAKSSFWAGIEIVVSNAVTKCASLWQTYDFYIPKLKYAARKFPLRFHFVFREGFQNSFSLITVLGPDSHSLLCGYTVNSRTLACTNAIITL